MARRLGSAVGPKLFAGAPLELGPAPVGLFSVVQRGGFLPFALRAKRMIENLGNLRREGRIEGVAGAADRER